MNKVWSQTLNAKFYIYNCCQSSALPCSTREANAQEICISPLILSVEYLLCLQHFWARTQTFSQSWYSRRGKYIFTSTIWVVIGKALALTSCLVTLVIFHFNDQSTKHSKLYSRRQPCFSCEVIRVLNRHSFFFFSFSMAKESTLKLS